MQKWQGLVIGFLGPEAFVPCRGHTHLPKVLQLGNILLRIEDGGPLKVSLPPLVLLAFLVARFGPAGVEEPGEGSSVMLGLLQLVHCELQEHKPCAVGQFIPAVRQF